MTANAEIRLLKKKAFMPNLDAFCDDLAFITSPLGGVEVNSSAAKRFIRSALWEAEKDGPSQEEGGDRKRIKLDPEPGR